ncbi:ABC transporter permease [Nocardia sp. NPDC019395]|uniref:ABC transporter permease n=1 Tax=Nocardia sp. NPDC019395 TaxID=3154686 RepID=UPI0033EEB1FC
MSTATATTRIAPAARPGDVDNRATYISFGLAYVVGHGSAALSKGPSPVLILPEWLPITLLGIGLAIGTVCATLAALRAQLGAAESEAHTGKLLGLSWIIGFAALAVAITGLTSALNLPDLQNILWPAGSSLIVGLIYLSEGAARRNTLHYSVGAWLALVAAVALCFSTPGPFWVLTIAGGIGYAVATVLEFRRLTGTSLPHSD